MRIGIIAHVKHAIREPFAGGLEQHTYALAHALRARGHDVVLFAAARSQAGLGVEALCEETALLDVGLAEATDVAFFREHHAYLALMTRLRAREFDVIHNNSLHYLPVSMAETLRTPMLTSLHTPPFCWLESGIRLAPADMRYAAVSRATARAWSPVVAVDHVVPNGVDLDRFPFSVASDPAGYWVWHGRIVPEKGLEQAIEAARLAGRPLRIAGSVPDRPYFDRAIRPRLGETASYVGHLAHRELARLLGGAGAALCTPRWEEPYGLVVAEALACGTPVAAFARGGVPEVVDASCGVLVAADDVQGLALGGLAAMALDRGACRRRAEAACDAERMIDGYEAIYREMVRKGPRGAPSARTAPLGAASLLDRV